MSQLIRPTPYSPPPPVRRTWLGGLRPGWIVSVTVLLALAGLVAYVFTARAVRLDFDPVPDSYAITGGLLNVRLGERHLLRPGSYVLRAEKTGFEPLRAQLDVGEGASQSFSFQMQKLPGLVSFVSEPVGGALVEVDGKAVGETPLADISLRPGSHAVRVSAPRYRPHESDIEVEGGGARQEFAATLEPAWAPIEVNTEPSGAEIRIDGELVGRAPAVLDVLEGRRRLEIALSGFKTVERDLEVAAGIAQQLPPVILEESDGRLALGSQPSGANITVNGVYRGQTPVSLALPPGRSYQIQFSRAGYSRVTRSVDVRAGEGRSLNVTLEPELGTVNVSVLPRDSRVLVNGKAAGSGAQVLVLPALPHTLRIERDGYAPETREITPRPGFAQDVEIRLRTLEQARYDAIPPRVTTAGGQTLKLVRPGSFRMGASRREPGRRANEVIRNVTLTRPYFIAEKEVTNEQFRAFAPGHESGIVGRSTLNLEKYPVVKVNWEQAARYCNWLSQRDGLEPAYVERDGTLVLDKPVGTGYRLPTEAEWIWAGRGDSGDKYPWGNTMPPAPGSGNFADDSARPLVARVVAGFNDGYAATAPVGTFAANARGLYDFGGNVAEWTNDFYAVNPSPGGAAETDPLGPGEGDFRVLRGASWMHATITELRWSFRDYGNEPRNDVGFRIARYAD